MDILDLLALREDIKCQVDNLFDRVNDEINEVSLLSSGVLEVRFTYHDKYKRAALHHGPCDLSEAEKLLNTNLVGFQTNGIEI